MASKCVPFFPNGISRVVAFDFETAAGSHASVCSLGYCVFAFPSGQLLDRQSTLINPQCAFEPRNIHIHGITPDMVTDSPIFPEAIKPLFALADGSTLFVAHSAATAERSMLEQSCARYALSLPIPRICDTLQLAKYYLPNLKKRGLKEVAAALDLPPFNHHDPLADAETCGRAFFAMLQIFLASAPVHFVRDACCDIYDDTPTYFLPPPQAEDEYPPLPEAVYSRSPFYGKECVITGDFDNFSHDEVELLINRYGGIYVNHVRRTTDILFLGNPSELVTSPDGKSTKLKSAEHFIEGGAKIDFCTEADFSAMLADCLALIAQNAGGSVSL